MSEPHSRLPAGVTKEQLDYVKQFNAGLSMTSSKSRMSSRNARGGATSGANGDPRLAIITGRPRGSVYSTPATRVRHAVDLSAPILQARTKALSIPPRSFEPAIAANNNQGLSTMETTAPEPSNPWNAVDTSTLVPPTGPRVASAAQSGNVETLNLAEDMSGRVLIQTTPQEPFKPFIPAHLHQTSVRATIAQIARMCGRSIDEITADGVTIPAPRRRTSAQSTQVLEAATFPDPTSSSPFRQSTVDVKHTWPPQASQLYAARTVPSVTSAKLSDMEMNVEPLTLNKPSPVSNETPRERPILRGLKDSSWASASKNSAQAGAVTFTPAIEPAIVSQGAVSVEPSRQLNAAATAYKPKRPTQFLKDSRWAD